jgi:hypothetical protein
MIEHDPGIPIQPRASEDCFYGARCAFLLRPFRVHRRANAFQCVVWPQALLPEDGSDMLGEIRTALSGDAEAIPGDESPGRALLLGSSRGSCETTGEVEPISSGRWRMGVGR